MQTLYYNSAIIFLRIAESLKELNIRLLKQINLHRIKALDQVFITITNTAAFIAYGLPVFILITGLLRNKTCLKRSAFFVLSSVLCGQIIAEILKYSICETRPFITYPFILKVVDAGSPSFPSGHTMDAFTMAISLCLVFRKWYVIIPAYLWASAVGYSRIDLGVHYPSDVIASALISILVSSAFFHLYKKKIIMTA